ncbi:Calcium-transporting ATPase 1 [Smittium culicis]|uniref:Calcium-transporting ATPase n=1 Tax=Smittium culicis TaxID=133412 RepID=A0A1R1Y3N5_9FUNG|nr:Calcium-transporting ATPase 1 [Smittium culicis]
MRLETTSDCARYSIEEILNYFKVDPNSGLQSSDARQRSSIYGFNVLESKEEESLFVKFFKGVFMNPMVLLLLGSSVISVLVGNYDDAFSIALAILIVSTVGFVQEYRSEQTLKALSALVPHFCNVIRDNVQTVINVNNLVPGDIVTFMTGDRIPADLRLIEAIHLEIDESNLTGESESRFKTSEIPNQINNQSYQSNLPQTEKSFNEQQNIAFMGTLIRNGNGKGVVCFTGSKTEFGRIHSMLQEIEEPRTPLQTSMDALGAQLSIMSFGVIAVIMLIGLIQGLGWMNMFTISVSLAVAAIPEGLSIVVTVTLAVGVFKMAKRKAICKKLPSVETLGSTSVICVDKTGTLTLNKMEVQYLYTITEGLINVTDDKIHQASSSWSYNQLLKSGNLCNNAKVNDKNELIGQATDIAMLNVALKIRGVDERDRYARISEIPFNSEAKRMSTVYPAFVEQEFSQSINAKNKNSNTNDQTITYVKGALESIIENCTTYYSHVGQIKPLTPSLKNEVLTHAEHLSNRGLRVVATSLGASEYDLSFIGFQVMKDPPRQGVENTIASLLHAGLRVVMITGDSEDTALAIASSVGIPSASGSFCCMTGKQLDIISDAELAQRINGISVFARSAPRHKVKIVKALQSNGDVVAMMGDGVNDAPALRLADIGISMGQSGTEVAKEASDLILVNDDLSTVLAAIDEGKSIFANIQNFLTFQLSTSVAALSLIAVSTAFGLPNPLNAMQILWINILMDGPPAQSLGVEPPDAANMSLPPRPRNAPILNKKVIRKILLSALIILSGTMFIYVNEMKDGVVTARDTTMTFTTFVLFDLFNALSCRSESRSIFELGLFSNTALNFAIGASLLGQLGVIYLPFLQSIFQTEALSLFDLLFLVMITSSVLIINECFKKRSIIISFFSLKKSAPYSKYNKPGNKFSITSSYSPDISDSQV